MSCCFTPSEFADELPPPLEDPNVSGSASVCSKTVNECMPNATNHSLPDPLPSQPEEDNGKVDNPQESWDKLIVFLFSEI